SVKIRNKVYLFGEYYQFENLYKVSNLLKVGAVGGGHILEHRHLPVLKNSSPEPEKLIISSQDPQQIEI
ncbi:hypothetical protein KJN74_05365, partial [Candidatus Bathyarchaeota archaeon]|nr:hypothetical protein [Candidatus Bathyarchaeota archaeon]